MVERDFPKSLPEFLERFGTDEQCLDYLFRQKWPEGFKCGRCGHAEAHALPTRLVYVCYGCRHHHSVTSDTAFHGTRKGLKMWFLALYLMVSSKQGLSAKELQRQLGLGSYKTAWTWLHKLRRCMVDPSRAPLEGLVEVDESYIGGPRPGVRGRGAAGKTAVACAVEKNGGKTGRVRLAVIENCSREKLQAFVKGQLKEESTVHTDGWQAYVGIEKSGYAHIRDVVDGGLEEAHVVLPAVHRVFSLLKRWVLGTHQGSASRKHLQRYLHEFEFRFNRRTSHAPTHLFQRLMEGVVRDGHCPYRRIVGRTNASTS
jgi:transposase-like protein